MKKCWVAVRIPVEFVVEMELPVKDEFDWLKDSNDLYKAAKQEMAEHFMDYLNDYVEFTHPDIHDIRVVEVEPVDGF